MMNLDSVYKQCYVANTVISYALLAAGAAICAVACVKEKRRKAREGRASGICEPADAAVMSGTEEARADTEAMA